MKIKGRETGSPGLQRLPSEYFFAGEDRQRD